MDISRPFLRSSSEEQLRQEAPLDAGLRDERGDHRLAHAALNGQRGFGCCLVQFSDLVGGSSRLKQQFAAVWVAFDVEL
ncbi:hypothetical protein [Mycobacterium asiaticum]|uniref:Uncharacterized protein n=1 Tax=Mycobacterium asiaticum TaxID=1790 RepID=A0A1A3CP04_MYCAS|nr:hypothetical protein [Mycobacterium asiaticum]OBI88645.1 hypothetical protein A9X01_14700 [Mycobacterium asiaticum]